jgi:hypothetical protein
MKSVGVWLQGKFRSRGDTWQQEFQFQSAKFAANHFGAFVGMMQASRAKVFCGTECNTLIKLDNKNQGSMSKGTPKNFRMSLAVVFIRDYFIQNNL